MANTTFNLKDSKTFWQEYKEGEFPELPIVFGIDSAGTIFFEQNNNIIVISSWEIKDFIKELKKLA